MDNTPTTNQETALLESVEACTTAHRALGAAVDAVDAVLALYKSNYLPAHKNLAEEAYAAAHRVEVAAGASLDAALAYHSTFEKSIKEN